MPIYGLNFNGTRIPADAPKFAQRIKVRQDGSQYAVGSDKACDYLLQGVCNTWSEAARMRMQADNGRRRIRQVERRGWIATYCG